MRLLVPTLMALIAQAQVSPYIDPSSHKIHFVPVTEDVKLEVLEWNGNGRQVVLLTSYGKYGACF